MEYVAKHLSAKPLQWESSEKATMDPRKMYDNLMIVLMPQGFVFRVDIASLKLGALCKKPLKKIISARIELKVFWRIWNGTNQ